MSLHSSLVASSEAPPCHRRCLAGVEGPDGSRQANRGNRGGEGEGRASSLLYSGCVLMVEMSRLSILESVVSWASTRIWMEPGSFTFPVLLLTTQCAAVSTWLLVRIEPPQYGADSPGDTSPTCVHEYYMESRILRVAGHLPGVLVSLSLHTPDDPCDSVGLAAVACRCGGGGSCGGDGASSGCCYWGWCGCGWSCSCWCFTLWTI